MRINSVVEKGVLINANFLKIQVVNRVEVNDSLCFNVSKLIKNGFYSIKFNLNDDQNVKCRNLSDFNVDNVDKCLNDKCLSEIYKLIMLEMDKKLSEGNGTQIE